MKNRLKKRRLYTMTQAFKQSRFWMTDEEYAWEFMLPVGREFGSPDYERLAALDKLSEGTRATADSIDAILQVVGESNKQIQDKKSGK